MSHPEQEADITSSPRITPRRGRCLKKMALVISLCMAAGTAVIVQHAKAYGVMASIHHGQVICHASAGTGPLQADFDQRPAMVRLSVNSMPDGQITVGTNGRTLADVLGTAYRANTLLMIDLHGASPTSVVQLVRKARMRDRVILMASDRQSLEAALQADSKVMVAFAVHSAREAHIVHRLAGPHPYAVYLPPTAEPSLFMQVHHDAEAIISENPLTARAGGQDPLAEKPVDIVITPLATAAAPFQHSNS